MPRRSWKRGKPKANELVIVWFPGPSSAGGIADYADVAALRKRMSFTGRERAMMTRTVDVTKESPDLKGLLSLVADGTEVLLTEGPTPVARLVPVGKRVAGLHAGLVWTSEDFDEPLPDEFWVGST